MKKNTVISKSDTLSDLVSDKYDASSDLVVAPAFAGKIAVDLTASIEVRWEAARDHENNGKARFAALGLLLLSLKKDMEHGDFLPELERRGFEERQARRAMSYASYVFSQPQKMQISLLEMPVTKVAVLAQADPEVVEALMEDGAADNELDALSVRGLKQLIADKTKSEANAAIQIQTLQLQVSRLEKTRAPVSPFLPRTEDIRAECLTFQKESELTLNSLRKLFEEINGDPHTPEWRYQIEQVWLTASIAAAMAADTLHAMREACSVGDLPDSVQSQHMMTPQEAKHWLVESAAIEGAYAGREAARSDQREQAKPKGPGRPKKIKTGDAK